MKELSLLSKGLFNQSFMDSRAKTRTVSQKERILGHLVGPLGLIFVVNTIAALVEKFFTQQTGAKSPGASEKQRLQIKSLCDIKWDSPGVYFRSAGCQSQFKFGIIPVPITITVVIVNRPRAVPFHFTPAFQHRSASDGTILMEHNPTSIDGATGIQLPASYYRFLGFSQRSYSTGKAFCRNKAPEKYIIFLGFDICPGSHRAQTCHFGVFCQLSQWSMAQSKSSNERPTLIPAGT